MKNNLFLFMLTLSVLWLGAQSNAPASHAEIPFHQYLQQHHQDMQRSGQNSRSIIYQEIAYDHDSMNHSSSTWIPVDSGQYAYNIAGEETGTNTYQNISAVWNNKTRTINITYDAYGNDTAYTNQVWNTGSSAWINSSNFSGTFNSNHNALTRILRVWNTANSSFLPTYKYTYAYDAHNNDTLYLTQTWDSANHVWVNFRCTHFIYNSGNYQTNSLTQSWSSGAWVNSYMVSYTIDMNGDVANELDQNWNTSAWVNSRQYNRTFDLHHDKLSEVVQNWNSGAWLNSANISYTYDANYNQTMELDQNWNSIQSAWVNSSRYTYTYDAANNNTGSLTENWFASAWTNSDKAVFTYNSNNNQTDAHYYIWITAGSGSWQDNNEYIYSYDANNNKTYELNKAYFTTSSLLESTDQYFYYYQSFGTVGITETKNELNGNLYPNPTTGNRIFVQFNLNENAHIALGVFDIQGRVVATETRTCGSGVNTFDLNYPGLAAGSYFVQILNQNNAKSSVLKFVKE